MSKSGEEFVDQMARQKMVGWCEQALLAAPEGPYIIAVPSSVFSQHAISKKWLSLAEGCYTDSVIKVKILSVGFDTAARFLKR